MILRKSRDNDPVFNFIMGAMVIGIDAYLIYAKISWVRESMQSRTSLSRSIEDSMEKGVFVREAKIMDPNGRVAPYVEEMWAEKQSEEEYSWLFIKTRTVHSDHRLVLKLNSKAVTPFPFTLGSEDRHYFRTQGIGKETFFSYNYLGADLPDTLVMLVRSDHENIVIDTVRFVL